MSRKYSHINIKFLYIDRNMGDALTEVNKNGCPFFKAGARLVL